jgi:hypothetical protein
VRATDLKQVPIEMIRSPDGLRMVNKHRNLARYDWRENILYLSHQKEFTRDINELISKCYDLNQATKRLRANNGKLKFEMYSPTFLKAMEEQMD